MYLMRRKFPLKVRRWMSLHSEGDEGRKIDLNSLFFLSSFFSFLFYDLVHWENLKQVSQNIVDSFTRSCFSLPLASSPPHLRKPPSISPFLRPLPTCLPFTSLRSSSHRFSPPLAPSLSLTAPIFHSVSPYARLITRRATAAATSVPHTLAGTRSHPYRSRSK